MSKIQPVETERSAGKDQVGRSGGNNQLRKVRYENQVEFGIKKCSCALLETLSILLTCLGTFISMPSDFELLESDVGAEPGNKMTKSLDQQQ